MKIKMDRISVVSQLHSSLSVHLMITEIWNSFMEEVKVTVILEILIREVNAYNGGLTKKINM